MNCRNLRASPGADVVYTQLDNSDGMLVHLGTQAFYTLNATGAFIWKMLEEGHNLEEIGDELQSRYEVTREQAKQSVQELANELSKEKLIEWEAGDPSC